MRIALFLALLAFPAESRDALEARIREIAASAGGTVGVSVLHLESGAGASVRGAEPLPMASAFKLPVAYELLRRVDRGALSLDQRIALSVSDLRRHSPIAERAPAAGITLSISELLEAMVVDGDNTAADLLLSLSGGPEVVTAQLEEAGLSDIRVDRSEAELAFDTHGVTRPPPRASWTPATLQAAFMGVPERDRRSAFQRFLEDPRDTATADALVLLLRDVQEGRRLSPDSRTRLIDLMSRTRTGPARIPAGLPPGTAVAHRTGLCGDFEKRNACTNDIGIVTLPGSRGHLAIAVLIRGSDRALAQRERTIARIARAAYDHWAR